LGFSLQLNRQEVLPHRIQSGNVVGGLSRRVLGTRIGAVFVDEKLHDLRAGGSSRGHAGVVKRGAPRVIGLLDAHALLLHQQSDQADHAVLAGNVNGEPTPGVVDNRLDRIDLGNAAHGGGFVVSGNGIVEPTSGVGRWRCHRLADLFDLLRSPRQHDE